MTNNSQLPSIGELLLPLLKRVSVEHKPLFIAIAERAAAERYRGWASKVGVANLKSPLLACANREDEIATLIESMYPDAQAIQHEILSKIPELTDTSFFSQYSMTDQFVIQAQGERLGAETWRSFAKQTNDSQARAIFLKCAMLEEESAKFLESIPKGVCKPEIPA